MQLPDDPLNMPPPYWRSSSAIQQVVVALEEVVDMLHQLIPVLPEVHKQVAVYDEKWGQNYSSNEARQEFYSIHQQVWRLEQNIVLRKDVAILMAAIAIEDRINLFCVYNLHHDIAESIEKLPPAEKLLVACTALRKAGVKGHAVFEAVKKLFQWRNAFAHGHCVDRPTKTLRQNHMTAPERDPSLETALDDLKRHCGWYLTIGQFLAETTVNEYATSGSSEDRQVAKLLEEIARFRVASRGNSALNFSIEFR